MRKLIIMLVFIIGLSIFFYPIISNWLSTKDHYTAITKHNEALAQLTKAEKEAEQQKAREFNASLTQTSIPIEDPFLGGESKEVNASYYSALDIGESMGSLEIPRIDVLLPIYHGVGEDVLQKGIGHMSNSSLPVGGEQTHAALTGHRGLPSAKLFRNLDQLELGDMFYVNALDEELAYKIDDIQIVLPTETSWLEMEEGKDYVTLITCEPYMINTHRLLVRGERVPSTEETTEVMGEPFDKTRQLAAGKEAKKSGFILILGGLVACGLVLLYLRERKRRTRS